MPDPSAGLTQPSPSDQSSYGPLQDPGSAIIATQRAAPYASNMPGVVSAAAGQPDSTSLVQGAAALKWGADALDMLHRMDPDHAAQAWAGLNQDQQKILMGVGYRPPGPSFLSSLAHPSTYLGDVAKVLGAPLRLVHHVTSAAQIELESHQLGSDVGSWSSAWNAASDPNFVIGGTKILQKSETGPLATGLDPKYYDMALDAAQGYNPNYLMGKYGPDAYAAVYQTPQWTKAVALLNAFKASPGRIIALQLSQLPGMGGQMNPGVTTDHVNQFNYLSGGIDAAWSVVTDPTTYLMPAANKALEARYAIQSAADVERLAQTAAGARGVSFLADAAEKGDYASIANRFPAFTGPGILPRFADATEAAQKAGTAIDSTHVVNFLKSEVGLEGMLNGTAPKIVGAAPYLQQMPHLGVLDPAKLALKNATGDVLDRLANTPAVNIPGTTTNLNPLRAAAKFINGMSNIYLAHPGGFDPLGPESTDVVRQVSELMGLGRPQRDALMNSWLTGDLATKRNIWKSMVDQTYSTFGSDFTGSNTPVSALGQLHQEAMGAIDQQLSSSGSVYGHDINGAPMGVRTLADGSNQSMGLYEHQLSQKWSVPNVRAIGQAQWQTGVVGKALDLMHIDPQLIAGKGQSFIKAWKAAQIVRPALGLRVGAEEGLSQIARDGILANLDARSAIRKVGQAVDDGAATPEDVQQWLVDNENQWVRSPDSNLPMTRAARVAYQNFGDAMAPPMKNIGGVEPAGLDDALGPNVVAPGAPVPKRVEFTPTGNYKSVPNGNPYSRYWWQQDLAHVPDSQIHMAALDGAASAVPGDGAQTAKLLRVGPDGTYATAPGPLQPVGLNVSAAKGLSAADAATVTYGDRLAAATRSVEDFLNSDAGKGLANRAGIAQTTATGESIIDPTTGEVNPTLQALAIHDWAQEAAAGTLGLTHDANGQPIQDLIDMLKEGKVPGIKDLAGFDPPQALVGRELIQTHQNIFNAIVNKGFDKVIDPMVMTLSRRPGFTTQLAIELQRLAPEEENLAATVGPERAAELTEQKAMGQALDTFGKFIHNPEVRSAWEQAHPAMTPFWFAKRQFYERWGRTIAQNPYAVRGGQLLMNGARDMGVVTQDQNGDDVFNYPATGILQQALLAGSRLMGQNPSLSVTMPFTSKVKYLSAGTAEGIMPGAGFAGFGPFVSVFLDRLQHVFPEAAGPLRNTALGPRGASQNGIIAQLVPSWLRSAAGALLQDPNKTNASSNQMASAMNYAIAQLAAQGKMPAEDAPPGEKQEFVNNVRQWARTTLLTRAMLGFTAPAAPSMDTLGEVKPDYLNLLQTLPLDQAMATFMKLHPNATPWTVFSTTSPVGGLQPLPANAAAGQFMQQNAGFVQRQGTAATWFIPNAPGGLDSSTYNTEFAAGLRERKTPEDFYNAVQVAGDSQLYYQTKDAYDRAAASAQGPAKAALALDWKNWKDAYLATRPLMADQIAQGGTRATERANAIAALKTAISDPDAPQGPDTDAMTVLLDAYDRYQAGIASLSGQTNSTATAVRKNLEADFINWAQRMPNDRALTLFNVLIKPGLPSTGGATTTTGVTG